MRPTGRVWDVDDFRQFSLEELFQTMVECQSPGYYQLAVEELQRRFLTTIGTETKRLADSSEKLERLTIKLKDLTWALIILTILAAAVPIGIELWKARRTEAEVQVRPSSSLDSRCQDLAALRSEKMMKEMPQDYLLLKKNAFFSKTIESCIYTEVPDPTANLVEFSIFDLSHSLIKDPDFMMLMHCDEDGADSAIVDKVRVYGGYMGSVRYDEWLDDGFGGPGRASKTPARPYTKVDCQKVYDKWMQYLN
jgi:hypothetical protein